MKTLLQKADNLKIEANHVLENTRVKEIFSKIGQVCFVGSYELNVLFRRDIDMFVVDAKDFSYDKAKEITRILLDKEMFHKVNFSNCVDYECPNGLNSYYWELVYIKDGQEWKFDVWYTDNQSTKTVNLTPVIKKRIEAFAQAREDILKRKQELYNGDTYKDNYSGFKIYEEVLGKFE